MNYCEVTDHNERVLSGEGEDDDEEKLEQINKQEREKKKKANEEKLVRMQVDREERMKRFKERQTRLSESLTKQLKALNETFVFSKNKVKNARERAQAMKYVKHIKS